MRKKVGLRKKVGVKIRRLFVSPVGSPVERTVESTVESTVILQTGVPPFLTYLLYKRGSVRGEGKAMTKERKKERNKERNTWKTATCALVIARSTQHTVHSTQHTVHSTHSNMVYVNKSYPECNVTRVTVTP